MTWWNPYTNDRLVAIQWIVSLSLIGGGALAWAAVALWRRRRRNT